MRTTPIPLRSAAENVSWTMWALSHRTGLSKSVRVPRCEVGEWTPRGTGIAVVHMLVSAYRCPAIFARKFHPDPPAGRLAHPGYRLNSSEARCQSDRRPNGTYVLAWVFKMRHQMISAYMP